MSDTTVIREGYCISDEELRRIQLIELEMLIEVDRICSKHNITYCISAGTLLGAIRHGGFIPWDDDADVAFLREEYDKFCKACEKDLDKERFYFQDSVTTPGYRWGHGKLRRKGTSFVRLHQESMPYEQGIYIDIMPYDSVPDNYIARKIHTFRCFLYRKCFWAPIGKNISKGMAKLLYQMLSKVPDKKLYRSYYRYIEKVNEKKTKRVRISTIPLPGGKDGYLREYLLNTVTIYFEGIKLKGIKDYDGYLTFKYGSYMELPPVEKRRTHPISSLSLIENDLIKEEAIKNAEERM
jgi:lipopolysaccharide cholinephosphotransferase